MSTQELSEIDNYEILEKVSTLPLIVINNPSEFQKTHIQPNVEIEKRFKISLSHPLKYVLEAKTTLPNSNFSFKDHQKIIKFYTDKLLASKTNEEVSFFLHQRGCVYFDSFQYELCENDLMESLKYNEKSASLQFDLCDLNCILKRFNESIKFGLKSIELDPTNPLGLTLIFK
jgi:tetratricopeptide (TPR) repeat protein